jgi:hypothetical protein
MHGQIQIYLRTAYHRRQEVRCKVKVAAHGAPNQATLSNCTLPPNSAAIAQSTAVRKRLSPPDHKPLTAEDVCSAVMRRSGLMHKT